MSSTPSTESIVGSRVVEVDYTSLPSGEPVGNFTPTGSMQLSQSGGGRVVEIDYTS